MEPTANETPRSSSWPSWTGGVQLALAFLLVATVSFFIGRWSLASHHPTPITDASHTDAVKVKREVLDLNRATHAELRLIPGIGDALAQRVVEHRARVGPFKNVDELRHVSGIGPKTLERLRPHLFVATEDDDGLPADSMAKPVRTASVSKKAAGLTGAIDINRADQAELQKLPGIGPKLSQRILDERAKKPFKSIDDLRRVSGIGPKTLEKLRPHVTIESPQYLFPQVGKQAELLDE
jgi:competence protein ComEA